MTGAALDDTRLARLVEVGRSLVAELDLPSLLDRLLATAQELTGARYAALGILDQRREQLEQFLTRGIDEATHREIGDLPRGHGILGVLIADPRPLRLPDVAADPRSYGFPVNHPPMGNFLGVPILIRGEAWGNLYLTEKAGGDFDEADEQAVVILSDWAAIAIDNARLFRHAEERRVELERAVRGFQATATIAQAVGAETHLDKILELVVKRGRALIEARGVLILLREGDDLVLEAGAGHLGVQRGARVPLAGSTAGDVLLARTSRRVADVESELRIPSARLGVPDATTALMVPLVYRGQPLGVLVAFDRITGTPEFTADDQQALEAFAASAATAVATARSVEAGRLRHSLQAAEDERGRWARELHDETLQGLAGLKVLLSTARRGEDVDAMRAAMTQATEQVSREIENLRAIITELRPAALDELGLEPALRTLMQRTAGAHGLDVRDRLELNGADVGRLSSELETAVYRLVQEALRNVSKHSQASIVEVEVEARGDELRLQISDDGIGFDPDAPSEGFGVVGMRERVYLLGGTLSIARADPGTVVTAVLPLARRADQGPSSPRSSA